MSAEILEERLREKEEELGRLLDEEEHITVEWRELKTKLKEKHTLGIAKIEKDLSNLDKDNRVGEMIRSIITTM